MTEGSIIHFPQSSRESLQFRVVPVRTVMNGESYAFPCIGLYDRETGIPAAADTGLEMYLRNLVSKKGASQATMRKTAYAAVSFLNFLLTRDEIDGIQDVTAATLHDYWSWYRTVRTGDGERLRAMSSWGGSIEVVCSFLENYLVYNRNRAFFRYSEHDLRVVNRNAKTGYDRPGFGIKPPGYTSVKNRILLYGYLDLLKRCAWKYDPMLLLALDLGCYAGAREGETVNLTPGGIRVISGPFGSADGIELDLSDEADFWNAEAVVPGGCIKRRRKQRVYPDFIPSFRNDLNRHLLLRREIMLKKGKDADDPDGPLFVNAGGNPLTVQMFSERLKKLFQMHFVPELEQYCIEAGCYDENKSYIDAYKADYPGAHMRRYWFTMYLKTKARLDDEEIRIWRGDRSATAFQHYLSLNYDLFEDYAKSAFYYQASIMEGIRHENRSSV